MARTISTSLVPIPKARAPNAPCVAVWLSPQTIVMPGWVSPSSGTDDVDDPLGLGAVGVDRDPELGAVDLQLLHLGGRHLVEDREAAGSRRGRVVRRGDRPLGPAHAQPAGAQAGERLGRGDLVDEVEVDGEDGGGALVLGDDVVVPDLLDERVGAGGRPGAGIGHGAAAPGGAFGREPKGSRGRGEGRPGAAHAPGAAADERPRAPARRIGRRAREDRLARHAPPAGRCPLTLDPRDC